MCAAGVLTGTTLSDANEAEANFPGMYFTVYTLIWCPPLPLKIEMNLVMLALLRNIN